MNISSLFDIQVNGFAGIDFQKMQLTEADLLHAVRALKKHATHRFFLTLITDHPERLCAKFQNIEALRDRNHELAECICGYHLEGPWLCPEDGFRGAHNPDCMSSPDPIVWKHLQTSANGNIRLVTLAPELRGSADFITQLVDKGVQVSLGHTNANHKEIDLAVCAGAKFCTHLGNGIPSHLHRHENVMHRLLARDELFAFFIPDGIHLPPSVLKTFFRAKPPGAALFTTDCMAAAGAPPGRYSLGDISLEVTADRIVRKPGKDHFAGSSLEPDQGVKNLVAWLGISLQQACGLFSTAIANHFSITLPQIEAAHLSEKSSHGSCS